jgi:uncharacterized protein
LPHIRTALIALALLLGHATTAIAQTPACTGKNILDELKSTDAKAHARILAAAKTTENANAVLWKIEKAGTPPSHLFGTMHLTDDRINNLSPTVKSALGSARRLALEIDDLSSTRLLTLLLRSRDLVMFTDGRRLEQLLSADEYKKVSQSLSRAGVPGAVATYFKPWVATLLMALSECEKRRMGEGQLPLDARLAKDAKQRGTPVAGLETLEEQFRAMASVPEADQVQILKAGLSVYDRIDDMIETLIQLYLSRQLGAIWPMQLVLAEKSGVSPKAFDAAEESLLVKRNLVMRDKAAAMLAEGGAFIAVGALHLPGKQGLIALLRKAGYTVTAVE